jgi:hypothetical protein
MVRGSRAIALTSTEVARRRAPLHRSPLSALLVALLFTYHSARPGALPIDLELQNLIADRLQPTRRPAPHRNANPAADLSKRLARLLVATRGDLWGFSTWFQAPGNAGKQDLA